ncbi:MAG: sigma-70 family RNA polymerase sigma factor [Sphingobacteriaceae bacterium]|nr:sigma-70 family RNA polymerase sigma factor [Cytophagaceae bacterium]
MPDVNRLADHLFRREAGKMVSVLTRYFGFAQREIAEDLVQETLLAALSAWRVSVPDDPTAWLYRVARNRALDRIRRDVQLKKITEELTYLDGDAAPAPDWFSDEEIKDSQLRMMFACCHPALPTEGQIALILKSLCGLSVSEIASAFLTSKDTIEKRLYRIREKIRQEGIGLDLPAGTDLALRLGNVLKTLYLLFNEGYHSGSATLVRLDLLEDALRFTKLLTDFPPTDRPDVKALLALMCFQTARADSRFDEAGGIVLLRDQDRARWNRPLIRQGILYLEQSAVGQRITPYHLEAAIAHEHCIAPTYGVTNWRQMVQYYDLLLQLAPSSSIVVLNRAVAVGEWQGAEAGLLALEPLADSLKIYHLFHAVRGEFFHRLKQPAVAREAWQMAHALAPSEAERRLLETRLRLLD